MSRNIKPHSGGLSFGLKLKAEFQFRTIQSRYITSKNIEKCQMSRSHDVIFKPGDNVAGRNFLSSSHISYLGGAVMGAGQSMKSSPGGLLCVLTFVLISRYFG